VIRTAAMIGGDQAWDKLAAFVVMDQAIVIDELLRAWRLAQDPEEYARTVLSKVAFGDLHVNVLTGPRVQSLRHLTSLTSLTLTGDYALLKDVADMPSLRSLQLDQNHMLADLAPLAACKTLRRLVLTGGHFLKDLSSLEDSTVEELVLKLVPADLSTLRCRQLEHLRIRDSRLKDGLPLLPADLPLRRFSIDNPPRSRSLVGVDQWQRLERVSMTGMPRADEIEALKRLPRLSWLSIHDAEHPEDLATLDPLDRLTDLKLTGLDESQREQASAALRHRPNLRIHFGDTRE
jgi:hypothetical protein